MGSREGADIVNTVTSAFHAGETDALDPLTFAVVSGALESIVREMTITMVKTSRSPILSEGYDFSNSLFDGRSRMVMQGENIPVHVGTMIEAGKAVTAFFGDEVYPGDLVYCNDPEIQGGHLPDHTMYRPVFFEDELVFWVANTAHMMDTGGAVAGGYNPYAEEIYAEGLRVSPVKLYERGKERKDVIGLLLANNRLPRALRRDLRAQHATVATAEKRLHALLEKYGKKTVLLCCDELLNRAERIMVQQIGDMPDGTYDGASIIEDYGHGLGDAVIEVTAEIREGNIRVALSAPPQASNYFNSYANNTKSMVFYGLLAYVDPNIPHNEGLYRPLTVDLGPVGSQVNPELPAPCAQATGSVADAIWEAVTEALSKAVPERACAGWGRPYLVIFTGVNPRTGERWADFSPAGGMGGGGAGWGVDGWHAIGWVNAGGALHHGDPESLEYKEPIRVWRHEIRVDSACPGRWRGGLGTSHEVELLAEVEMTTISEGTKYSPPSRLGPTSRHVDGNKVHRKWIQYADGKTEEIHPQTVVSVPAGAHVCSHTAGGGGVGHPLDRDIEAVQRDVINELVSIEAARQEYGVVIDSGNAQLDAAETRRVREALQRREGVAT